MDPKITNFAELERFIKEHPEEKDAIEEAYFYLREKGEDEQMQTEGHVDPFKVPVEFLAQTALALAFRNRIKTIEEDKDYQELVKKHKGLWSEKNKGKDFTSKEGLDYLYGSLEDEGTPTLKKDAEQEFRNNPRFKKRIERYDKEKKKVYENPNEDPAVVQTRYEIENHTRDRHAYLKTHEDKRTPEEVSALIQKRSWERFATEHPEKTKAYTQTSLESVTPPSLPPLRPILSESRTIIPQTERSFDSIEGRETDSTGRRFGLIRRRGAPGFERVGIRLISRLGTAAGRIAVGALTSSPIGWVVIGVIVVVIIIVFIIIMLLGGGGFGGEKPVPTIECIDPDGNIIVVEDGNACAQNHAAYYSREEGIVVTATCRDQCTDFVGNSCDRNASNTCDFPLSACGAPLQAFCIEYTPADASLGRQHDCLTGGPGYVGTPLGVSSCSGIIVDIPTPTP